MKQGKGLKDFLKGCLYAAFMLALVGLFKYGNGYFDNKTIRTFHYDSYRTNPLPKDTLGIGESKCLPVKQDISSPTFQLIRIDTSDWANHFFTISIDSTLEINPKKVKIIEVGGVKYNFDSLIKPTSEPEVHVDSLDTSQHDTIKVIMLVCDTSISYGVTVDHTPLPIYDKNINWKYGFEVRNVSVEEFIPSMQLQSTGDPNTAFVPAIWIQPRKRNVYTHKEYLNADKTQLSKNIIVWMSKECIDHVDDTNNVEK
jgi:hypothetical protein